MISELKREALESLRGRWGLSVGATFIYYLMAFAIMFGMYFIFFISTMFFVFAVGGVADGVTDIFYKDMFSVGALIIFLLLYFIFILALFSSQGITLYGYYNTVFQLSKKGDVTIDSVFEGFRGFKRMMVTMRVMILIPLYSGIWLPFLVMLILPFLIPGDSSGFVVIFIISMVITIILMIMAFFSYSMTFFVLIEHPEYPVLRAMKESKAMMKGHKMDLFLLYLSFIGWLILGTITIIGVLWVIPYMYTTTAHFYQYISENK
ncbi:hypothetical protein CN354_18140 [Bacillus cereus]|nr:hypothetical protein CN354_18140 [Bacillus cereus]